MFKLRVFFLLLITVQVNALSLASRGAVSMINNGFDPFKVAEELTSEEALKSLGTDMAYSGPDLRRF
jgi:hypothetical protein